MVASLILATRQLNQDKNGGKRHAQIIVAIGKKIYNPKAEVAVAKSPVWGSWGPDKFFLLP